MGTLKSSTLGTHPVTISGGVVDPAAAVADADALTLATPVSETYDDAELEALRADVVEVRAQLNALLASLRAADLLDT